MPLPPSKAFWTSLRYVNQGLEPLTCFNEGKRCQPEWFVYDDGTHPAWSPKRFIISDKDCRRIAVAFDIIDGAIQYETYTAFCNELEEIMVKEIVCTKKNA